MPESHQSGSAAGGIVRHSMTAGGGAGFAHGMASGNEIQSYVSAAIAILGFILSIVDKLKRGKGTRFEALVAPLLIGILFTGCAGRQIQSLEVRAKAVAWVATAEILESHPEWRPHFVQARDDLRILADSHALGAVEVMAILHRLPVRELRSARGALYFGAAVLILEDAAGLMEIENPEWLRAAARGLIDGITLGLTRTEEPDPGPETTRPPPMPPMPMGLEPRLAPMSLAAVPEPEIEPEPQPEPEPKVTVRKVPTWYRLPEDVVRIEASQSRMVELREGHWQRTVTFALPPEGEFRRYEIYRLERRWDQVGVSDKVPDVRELNYSTQGNKDHLLDQDFRILLIRHNPALPTTY
jgi:hypothetical protein